MNYQGLNSSNGFSSQELQQLVQHHDRIVNPTNNEFSKKIGCSSQDFEICEELGKGAHGVVFKVKSKRNNQLYVLKRINFNNLKQSYKKEALREVQLLRRLSNPHVIRYYNSFMEEECLYIIMEYAQRGDLHKYLKQKREKKETIPESEIWLIAFQICLGVGYLHYQKIIHRDLKCMNVLMAEDGTIKIGDLGVSKVHQQNPAGNNLFGASDSKPASQQKSRVKLDQQVQAMQGPLDSKIGRVGTPLYLSPEMVRQQPYDYKVDTWAVGCCLFHLAALEPPFLGENIQQLGTKILNEQPKSLPSGYSEKLSNFVLNILLQKDANARPYINSILRKPTKYFAEEVIREYREKIFMNLKYKPSHIGTNELDFIYQVLIGAGQYEATHSKNVIFDSQSKEVNALSQPNVVGNLPQNGIILNNEFYERATQSRFLKIFPNSQQRRIITQSQGQHLPFNLNTYINNSAQAHNDQEPFSYYENQPAHGQANSSLRPKTSNQVNQLKNKISAALNSRESIDSGRLAYPETLREMNSRQRSSIGIFGDESREDRDTQRQQESRLQGHYSNLLNLVSHIESNTKEDPIKREEILKLDEDSARLGSLKMGQKQLLVNELNDQEMASSRNNNVSRELVRLDSESRSSQPHINLNLGEKGSVLPVKTSEYYQAQRSLLLSQQNKRRLTTNTNQIIKRIIPGVSSLRDQSKINESSISGLVRLPNNKTEQNFYKPGAGETVKLNERANMNILNDSDSSNNQNNNSALKKEMSMNIGSNINQYSNENVTTTIGTTYRNISQANQSVIQNKIPKPSRILPAVQQNRIQIQDINKLKLKTQSIIDKNLSSDTQQLLINNQDSKFSGQNQQIFKKFSGIQDNQVSEREQEDQQLNSQRNGGIWSQGMLPHASQTQPNGFAVAASQMASGVTSYHRVGRNHSSHQQSSNSGGGGIVIGSGSVVNPRGSQPVMSVSNGFQRMTRPQFGQSNGNITLGSSFTINNESQQTKELPGMRPFSRPSNLIAYQCMQNIASGSLPGFLNKRLTINDLMKK